MDRDKTYGYITSRTGNYRLLSGYAKRNRLFMTDAESILWNFLRGRKTGYRFRRQHPIGDYIADFVCLRKMLVIEVDGGYHYDPKVIKEDITRTNYLRSIGYNVIRFTNEQIYVNLDNVMQTIMNELNNTADSPAEAHLLGRGRGRCLILSAPSGSGKSTIVQYLMKEHPEFRLAFSISATSRAPRGTEQNGVEYFFISNEEFRQRVANGEFLEYEEVYGGTMYGTLKQQVESQLEKGQNVVFDVDVKGGCNIKRFYGDRALSLFIQPPSIEALRERLVGRGTDSPEKIEERLAKAEYEMTFAPNFDHIIVNDDLEVAKAEAVSLLNDFLKPEQQ